MPRAGTRVHRPASGLSCDRAEVALRPARRALQLTAPSLPAAWLRLRLWLAFRRPRARAAYEVRRVDVAVLLLAWLAKRSDSAAPPRWLSRHPAPVPPRQGPAQTPHPVPIFCARNSFPQTQAAPGHVVT